MIFLSNIRAFLLFFLAFPSRAPAVMKKLLISLLSGTTRFSTQARREVNFASFRLGVVAIESWAVFKCNLPPNSELKARYSHPPAWRSRCRSTSYPHAPFPSARRTSPGEPCSWPGEPSAAFASTPAPRAACCGRCLARLLRRAFSHLSVPRSARSFRDTCEQRRHSPSAPRQLGFMATAYEESRERGKELRGP